MASATQKRVSTGSADWMTVMHSVRRRLTALPGARKPASVGFFAEPLESRMLMANAQPTFFAIDPPAINELEGDENEENTDVNTLPISFNVMGTGTLAMTPNDDGSTSLIDIGFNFDFYGNTYNRLFINNNGNVTFTQALSAFTATGFPQGTPIVAPFWADVDTRGIGEVRYSTGVSVRGNNFFQVDWNNVGYYNTQKDLTNTFTLYMEDDAAGDIVAFKYDQMTWTTGSASGGTGGYGGTGAQIGFDSGDSKNFLSMGRPNSFDAVTPFSNKLVTFRMTEEGAPIEQDFQKVAVDNWATFYAGSEADVEDGQIAAEYIVTNVSNPGLFATQPRVTQDGTLRYSPRVGVFGTSTFNVRVRDNGGDDFGGEDISEVQTFTITINPVNDAPTFKARQIPAIAEDSPPVSIGGWATSYAGSKYEVPNQIMNYMIENLTNEAMFLEPPSVSPDGTLTYSIYNDLFGESTFKIRVVDDGGTEFGGVDASDWQTFSIVVHSVNDQPTLIASPIPPVGEDAGKQTILNWASFNPGPANEQDQTPTYVVSDVSNIALFSQLPTVSPDGTLTYTPAPNASGTSTFRLRVRDSGTVDFGGNNLSEMQIFTITVQPFNDRPQIDSMSAGLPWFSLGETVGLTVSGVSDSDNAITGVWYYRDANGNNTIDPSDQFLGIGQSFRGGKWLLDVKTEGHFEIGKNTVLAIAKDDGGTLTGGNDTSVVVSTSFEVYRQALPSPGTNFVEYNDANGNKVRLSLVGGGVIKPLFDQEGDANPVRVLVIGSKAASSVMSVSVTKSKTSSVDTTTIGDLEIAGGLATLNGAKLNLGGSLIASSLIKTLTLNNVNGGSEQLIKIGGTNNDNVNLNFGQLVDVSVNTSAAISNFKAVSWRDTSGPSDALTAASVNVIRVSGKAATKTSAAITGNFEADIKMTSSTSTSRGVPFVGLIQITGNSPGNWDLGTQKLNAVNILGSAAGLWQSSRGGFGNINIFGKAESLTVVSGGDITNFKAGQAHNLSLLSKATISKVSVVDWDSGVLAASKLNSLAVTGRAASKLGPVVAGDLHRVQIALTGQNVKTGQQTLGSMRVAGQADGHFKEITWSVTGNVGSINLGSALGIDLDVSGNDANAGNIGTFAVAEGLNLSHIHASGAVNNINTGWAKSSEIHVDGNIGTFLSRGAVNNTMLLSNGNINTITSVYWNSGAIQADKINQIIATGLPALAGSLAVAGNFLADVAISGEGVASNLNSLGVASISGTLLDSVWRINGNAGKLSVGAISGSTIYVGVNSDTPSHGMIDTASAFNNPYATLTSFIVTGKGVAGESTPSFTNSKIAAGILQNVILRYVDTTVELPNGLTAVNGIGNYVRKVGPGVGDVITVRNQTDARVYDPMLGTPPTGGYKLQIVAWG